MADALGPPLVVAEFLQTHTPSDPHARALALAQKHGKELQQRRQNQSPHAPECSVHHVVPHMRDPVSGARGHAR